MRDVLKEVGKYFLDISKIVFAVAVIAPLVKESALNWYGRGGAMGLFAIGVLITYQGVKNGSD